MPPWVPHPLLWHCEFCQTCHPFLILCESSEILHPFLSRRESRLKLSTRSGAIVGPHKATILSLFHIPLCECEPYNVSYSTVRVYPKPPFSFYATLRIILKPHLFLSPCENPTKPSIRSYASMRVLPILHPFLCLYESPFNSSFRSYASGRVLVLPAPPSVPIPLWESYQPLHPFMCLYESSSNSSIRSYASMRVLTIPPYIS